MITRFSHGVILIALLCFLVGCSNTVTVVVSPTASATATSLPATATPTPGVCNAADFPTHLPDGPASGFQYPPLTYHGNQDGAAGTYYYLVCSSGTPTSIFTFLQHSIPAGGWTITANTATTLTAVQTNLPQEGLCASVDITVGSHAGYPGEWNANFHSPTSSCK